MDWIAAFFEQNFIIVYFFYGLAFFCMGLAILLESRRSSALHLAEAVLALALFGIIHGLHEWFEMFQLLHNSGAANVPHWLLWEPVRIVHLVVSFALLLFFGVQLIFANREVGQQSWRIAFLSTGVLLLAWFVAWLSSSALLQANTIDLADVLARYMLAIPGSLLAGWALVLERRSFRMRGVPQFGNALLLAATAVLLYGLVGQIFTRPSALFPSNIINSVFFQETFGIPVQAFRTGAAILMAFAVTRALRVFDVESAQELALARAERLKAQKEKQEATQRLNVELQRAVMGLRSLNELSRQLNATLDQQVILQQVLPAFVHDEPSIGASMIVLQPQAEDEAKIAVKTACPAPEHDHVDMQQMAFELGKRCIANGQPHYWDTRSIEPVSADTPTTPHNPWPDDAAEIHIIGFPLEMRNAISGSVIMCTAPDMNPFSAEEYSMIGTASRQFSAALQNAQLYEQVQRREAIRGELLHQIVSAQENERQRIARELHDGPGQTLTGLGLGLAATEAIAAADPTVNEKLGELKKLNGVALQEIRDIITDLRPSLLDDLGLVAALRSIVHQAEERTARPVELIVQGQRRRLDPQTETIIYRIVQEAVINTTKHAHADHASVTLTFGDSEVGIAVTDDGHGFDTSTYLDLNDKQTVGWGLLGIQERVALVGGTCQIESAPGRGTRITVSIPLNEPAPVNGGPVRK